MATYTIGDIHGRYEALLEVLKKSKFDYEKDKLIVLGDIVDGGSQTKEVVNELIKIKNIIFCCGNHDCIDHETEALTNQGWKKFYEIQNTDKIYSLDLKSKFGIWTNINKIIIKPHTGKMITVNGTHLDMKATPNHRILHQRRVGTTFGELKYETAENMRSRIRIPLTANMEHTTQNISDDMIRLVAWIITDGSITTPINKKHNPRIFIYPSKLRTIKKIIRVLNKLGLEYQTTKRSRKIEQICGKKLKSCMPQYIFKISLSENKKIFKYITHKYVLPYWAYHLSNKQYKIFLNTLIEGDGSKYKNKNNCQILYGMKDLLDQIQISCILHGFCAYLSCDNRGHPRLNISKSQSYEFDSYRNKKSEPYSGVVWCLNVPQSNFMVRRNGKHYFTGNCWFIDWYLGMGQPLIWTSQGGTASMKSYNNSPKRVPKSHREFFRKALKYFVDEKNRLYVHGGFDINSPIDSQPLETVVWDRELIQIAMRSKIKKYKHVFIGHSTTQMFGGGTLPLTFHNLTMLDTGGGFNGKLTIMNVDTMKYWQSKLQEPVR